ncbi:MAG: hypothetical protein V8S42_05580 [Lachnospiraceae bacterium]
MKIEQKQIEKIAYGSFYLGVIIEVLMVIIDKSALINPVEGRLFQLTFLLFLIKTCLTRYDKKEYAVIAAFLALGAISYFVTGRNDIVRIVMFLAACKNVDMQKCMKLVFYMTLTGCLLIMFLSFFGVGGGLALTQDYGRGSVETRYTLGMGHPNALQCMVFALTVLALYLYGEKWKWYGYAAALAVNTGFFFLTDSKTSFLVAVFAVLYTGLYQFTQRNVIKIICNVVGKLLVTGSIVFSIFISWTAHYVYEYDWEIDTSSKAAFFKKLDIILTGRVRSLTSSVRWEGTIRTWKLFSEPANNYYFDMGWIRLFYWYGIIPACVFIISLLVLMWYCVKKEDYRACIMIVSLSVYAVMEAHTVSIYIARNYVLFLFGMYWTDIIDERKWKGLGNNRINEKI